MYGKRKWQSNKDTQAKKMYEKEYVKCILCADNQLKYYDKL